MRTDEEIAAGWGALCMVCDAPLVDGERHVERAIVDLVVKEEHCGPITKIYVVCQKCHDERLLI